MLALTVPMFELKYLNEMHLLLTSKQKNIQLCNDLNVELLE